MFFSSIPNYIYKGYAFSWMVLRSRRQIRAATSRFKPEKSGTTFQQGRKAGENSIKISLQLLPVHGYSKKDLDSSLHKLMTA